LVKQGWGPEQPFPGFSKTCFAWEVVTPWSM